MSHAVVWQTTSKNATKVRAARAARLYFLIQPIRFSGVVIAVAVGFSAKSEGRRIVGPIIQMNSKLTIV